MNPVVIWYYKRIIYMNARNDNVPASVQMNRPERGIGDCHIPNQHILAERKRDKPAWPFVRNNRAICRAELRVHIFPALPRKFRVKIACLGASAFHIHKTCSAAVNCSPACDCDVVCVCGRYEAVSLTIDDVVVEVGAAFENCPCFEIQRGVG